MSLLVSIIAAGLVFAAPLLAGAPAYQVRVTLEIIGLDPATSFPLLSRLHGEQSDAAALRELDAMVSDGRAELLDRPTMLLGSGKRGSSESIEEFRYAGERDLPHPPQAFGEETAAQAQIKPRFIDRRYVFDPHYPDTFDTRNTGAIAEAEPTVSEDGSQILLNIVPQCVLLERMQTFVGGTDEARATSVQQQPWFTTAKLYTSLKLRSGSRIFLADFAAADVPRRRTLVFLISATATPISKPSTR